MKHEVGVEYGKIGTSEIKVTPVCVGTAFRGLRNGQTDERTCIRVVERAIDMGLNFFDCANIYKVHPVADRLTDSRTSHCITMQTPRSPAVW